MGKVLVSQAREEWVVSWITTVLGFHITCPRPIFINKQFLSFSFLVHCGCVFYDPALYRMGLMDEKKLNVCLKMLSSLNWPQYYMFLKSHCCMKFLTLLLTFTTCFKFVFQVWKRFTQFEQTYGDLSSMLKVRNMILSASSAIIPLRFFSLS